MRLFLNEEFDEYRFHQMEMKYYQHHYKPVIYVELDDDIDFFSEEKQLEYLRFEEALISCENCQRQWFKNHTLDSWFSRFRDWYASGACR